MKYILLIIVAFLIVQEVPAQVRLSTMDSVTTFTPTDLFWLNTKPSSAFLNRKVSWRTLRSNIEDFMADSVHTWALKQTFSSGATFSAGANGTVTFSDSVVNTGTSNLNRIYPTTSTTSQIGTLAAPYQTIWARNIQMPNTEGNDSCVINYDDSTITLNKTVSVANLKVTNNFDIPDSTTFNGLALSGNVYTPTLVSDSIITLGTMVTSIRLSLPGDITSPGIEKILMAKAGDEQILVITNRSSYSITMQDGNADGNLALAGDFTMGLLDIITLKYDSYLQYWVEVSRSNN